VERRTVDDAYASAYAQLARRHWWWQARDRIVAETLSALPIRQGASILDVGCGDGRLFPVLDQFGSVTGIEPDPLTLGTMSADPRIHHVPFRSPLTLSGPFDLVSMFDVLEHLEDRIGALALVREVLSPTGLLLLTVPALPVLWTRHDDLNHHHVRYTDRSLRSDLEAAGLRVRTIRYIFQGLVVPKAITVLGERLGLARGGVPAIPAPFLNRVFREYCLFEARCTKSLGRWLPGTTLLATVAPT